MWIVDGGVYDRSVAQRVPCGKRQNAGRDPRAEDDDAHQEQRCAAGSWPGLASGVPDTDRDPVRS